MEQFREKNIPSEYSFVRNFFRPIFITKSTICLNIVLASTIEALDKKHFFFNVQCVNSDTRKPVNTTTKMKLTGLK